MIRNIEELDLHTISVVKAILVNRLLAWDNPAAVEHVKSVCNDLCQQVAKAQRHAKVPRELHYKHYTGNVHYSARENKYFGAISGIKELISYEGPTLKDLHKSFCEAVDRYKAAKAKAEGA